MNLDGTVTTDPPPAPASDPAAATPDTERTGPSATSHEDAGEDNSTLLEAVRSVVQEELHCKNIRVILTLVMVASVAFS